jgi:hypothetical protein
VREIKVKYRLDDLEALLTALKSRASSFRLRPPGHHPLTLPRPSKPALHATS